ncbi:MAG: alpha/beta hydrolase [Elusimicrobiota bacterium]
MCLCVLLSGCAAERIYYYPNRVLYADPDKLGLDCELVSFPSLNGAKLYALYFPTSQEPKGTVVHFHGNFGNVSNHFPLTTFLLGRGFDLLVFDYQGFGGSEGKPSPKRTVEDGIAAVRYAHSRLRAGGVVVLGQSLGAAVAAETAAREPLVAAAVLEAGFTSYRAIMKTVMRRGILTWPFSFFVPALVARRRHDPIDSIDEISPRPVLIVHGTADKVVPVKMSRRLYEAAREPKELWIIEGAGHLQCRRAAGLEYEARIEAFVARALAASSKSNKEN